MKTITKKYNALEIEDIENAVSEYIGKDVKISDIKCILEHCIPLDEGVPSGQILIFMVDGDEENPYGFHCDSIDLWDGEDGHFLNGKQLALDEDWASADMIFAFDTDEFKSFDEEVDGSD